MKNLLIVLLLLPLILSFSPSEMIKLSNNETSSKIEFKDEIEDGLGTRYIMSNEALDSIKKATKSIKRYEKE